MRRGFILAVFVLVILGSVGVRAYQADFAVYTGSGTWGPSIQAFENFLEWKGLTWREINKNDINGGGLVGNYRGLFMPGGWAGNYNRDIKNSGDQEIRNFISSGGAYIGMSAGAFYACDIVIWEGSAYNYPSDIFDGDCIGPIEEIAPWPEYTMTTMTMNLGHEANIYEPLERDVLYYGEPYFVANQGQEMNVLASWQVPSNPGIDGTHGIISFNYGNGRVVLVGPHPEIEEDDSRDGNTFGEELSDGDDGSDWPFLWTAVDWMLKEPITQPPGVMPKQCNDGIDNDGDGAIDVNDPGCVDVNDNDEVDSPITQCNDGLDNDGDGLVDLNDIGCDNADDDDEFNLLGVDVLFDDFEDGNLDGWSLYGIGVKWDSSQDTSFEGSWAARAKQTGAGDDSFMEHVIDVSSYTSVSFEYYRKLVGLDAADDFQVEYFDGYWITLEHLGSSSENNANFVFKSFSIPNSATSIRFKCEVGAVSEKCYIDNVRVFGE